MLAHFKKLIRFLKSTDFSKAMMIGIAITTPIGLGILFDRLEIGLAIGFGAFWSSPSDVNGSYRHKKFGILFSAGLIMVVSFIGGYLRFDLWYLVPVLGILTFAISYISVFGFRASLISFSGLLALVLSFAFDPKALEVYQFSLLIGLGGLWYLSLVMIWNRINPRGQTEEALTKSYNLTADFLETRGKLINPLADRNELLLKLSQLQSDLIESHETLRDILILSRTRSGQSNYQNKRLLVFVQLVEMLELAIANPAQYDKMDAYFTKHPTHATSFQNLIFAMANQLRAISEAGHFRKKLPKNDKLTVCFEKVGYEITALKSGLDAKDFEEYLIIQNLFEYQERQLEKLKKITWLLGNPDIAPKDYITKEAARRFVAPQDYDPAILLRNFNFSSNLFKHSLRLALTVMIGYVVGSFLDFQNPYWILLTIIVILRPSYGLTRSRSKQRIIGTLIGGALATGIVFLVHDAYVYGVLGIVSLIIAFSMIQKNYRTAATFITLSVIFIYAIIRPDVQEVIQYRVLDTVVGAALSFMAIWLFWPSWSFQKIESDIEKSIRANKDFLGQIIAYYEQKGKVPIALKVSRKQAFMETSNLSAAFQAMTQEPKSKQNNLDSIYELVVLNHSFLSSLASLSGYIQNHSTTKASTALKTSVNYIDQNLEQVLKSVSTFQTQKLDTVVDNEDNFKKQLISLSEGAQEKLNAGRPLSERDHQEAHLINEQLRWLFSLSQKMLKTMTNRPKTKS